jgi:DNA polymerase
MSKITALAGKIKACKKCRLSKKRINAVPGEGDPRAKLMFIGEAPGAKEDETGKPFMGMAGVFLDSLLKKFKIKRKNIFITSIVKCRPPDNRDPKQDEIKACSYFLNKQIKLIKPKLIVLLGDIALRALLNEKKVSQFHGDIFIKSKIKYIPTFHPSAGMRFPRIRKLMEDDFKKIKKNS